MLNCCTPSKPLHAFVLDNCKNIKTEQCMLQGGGSQLCLSGAPSVRSQITLALVQTAVLNVLPDNCFQDPTNSLTLKVVSFHTLGRKYVQCKKPIRACTLQPGWQTARLTTQGCNKDDAQTLALQQLSSFASSLPTAAPHPLLLLLHLLRCCRWPCLALLPWPLLLPPAVTS